MLTILAVAVVALAVLSFILWRKNMSVQTSLDALNVAADAAKAKIADQAAQIVVLAANQEDPAKEAAIADAIDAVTAKLTSA